MTKHLPQRRQIKPTEALWISGIDDASPASAWQKGILDERWQAYRAGQAKRLSLQELERRLKRS